MLQGKTGGSATPSLTIPTNLIVRLVFMGLALVFLYLIRDVVVIFLAALFLAALIDPLADWLASKKIPRGVAALMVYVVVIFLVVGAFVLVVPPLLEQLRHFLTVFNPYLGDQNDFDLASIFSWEILSQNLQQVLNTAQQSGLPAAVPQLLQLGTTAIGVVATGFVILILAFFLVVEKTALVKAVAFITPEVYQEFVTKVAGKIRQSLGSWLRGQLIMMLAVGLLTYLALTIIGVQYALLLGVVAGLFEIVPFIGPWLSAVPGVIFALAISPVHAVITAAAYLAIQVVEGNVLLPKVMQSVTGLNPIVSLLAVLVGWRVGGVVGVLLSLPITMALGVVMTEIYKKRVLT